MLGTIRKTLLVALLSVGVSASADAQSEYRPIFAAPEQPELVVVFVTMSTCVWSNRAGFDSTIKELKLTLAQDAADRGERLVLAAVALDWEPRVGLEYILDRFGAFDEVSAGRNWWNSGALDRIWRAAQPVPETPQIFVYRRMISAGARAPVIGADSLIAHIRGFQGITDWFRAGGTVATATRTSTRP